MHLCSSCCLQLCDLAGTSIRSRGGAQALDLGLGSGEGCRNVGKRALRVDFGGVGNLCDGDSDKCSRDAHEPVQTGDLLRALAKSQRTDCLCFLLLAGANARDDASASVSAERFCSECEKAVWQGREEERAAPSF
jgi:hypothetical protein